MKDNPNICEVLKKSNLFHYFVIVNISWVQDPFDNEENAMVNTHLVLKPQVMSLHFTLLQHDSFDGFQPGIKENDNKIQLSSYLKKKYSFAPCKGSQDSLGFWIPHRGLGIPGIGFHLC